MSNAWGMKIDPSPRTLRESDFRKLYESLKTPTTRLIGRGDHATASPSHAVERQPFVWDCNGFYRRLGLKPGASRVEVARAFMDLDGHRSSRLTNAARVLIDRITKRVYDALPLGAWWADDEDLIAAVTSGEVGAVHDDDGWAWYVSDVDEADCDTTVLDALRVMIAHCLWVVGCDLPFAMGFAPEGRVEILGYRIVCFVPLTSKQSWEYAAQVAFQIHRLAAPQDGSMLR